MASISDILSTIQQGVVAVNNLVSQSNGSLLNIQSQLGSIDQQIGSIDQQIVSIDQQIGNIGQYVTATLPTSTPVSFGISSAANIISVSLSTGVWNLWGTGFLNPGGAATTLILGISSQSRVFQGGTSGLGTTVQFQATFASAATQVLQIICNQVTLTSSATYFLVTQLAGSSGTASGILNAQRIK